MKDRDSKTIFADVVEAKGRGLGGTVENVVRNIASLGYKKVTLCSDQEPAILDLIEGIIAARKEPTIPQNSPVGESQANGLVERAFRSVKDQVRTLRLALQKRVGCRIPVGHPIMTWIVKHAGELISKYQLNRDGQTAYYKVFGKPCKDVIVEIGEEVHYRVSEVDTGSLDSRWESGIWLRIRWENMEHHIGTPEGVIKSYTIERKPLEDRWSKGAVEAIVGTHGAHNHHLETPVLHACYHLFQLASSCETNPGQRNLKFAPLPVQASPNTISIVGDIQKDAYDAGK